MTSIDDMLSRQIRRWELERAVHDPRRTDARGALVEPVITVSRSHGAGGSDLAAKLAERFGYTLLHRDVIDRICESSGYKRRLVAALDGHARSQLKLWFESVLQGQYLDASDYVKALLEVIYSISHLGGVVVVGRGANFILGPDRGFHLRVVAPVPVRVTTIMARFHCSEREALHRIEQSDHERADFVRKVYGRAIDDPLGYDLVLNEISISMDAATTLVAAAAQAKFERLRQRMAVSR